MKVQVLVLAGLLGTGSVIAQDVTTLAEFEKKTMTSPCSAATFRTLGAGEGSEVAENSNDFEKLGFGGGYAALISVGDGDRIEDAQLVNDIVRVTKDQNVQFGPVLEMHKFIGALSSQTLYEIDGQWRLAEDLPEKCADVLENFQRKRVPLVGVGPFVTVRLGGSEVVQSFGAGVMFGFRTAESEKSLNLGIAYVTDPSVRTLGDGIVEGQALPTGETQIRYKTTDMYGFMALFSVGW